MRRTIGKLFFHPYEVPTNKEKEEIGLNHCQDENQSLYYNKIPKYFEKIYRVIDFNLNEECNSIIPSKQSLP